MAVDGLCGCHTGQREKYPVVWPSTPNLPQHTSIPKPPSLLSTFPALIPSPAPSLPTTTSREITNAEGLSDCTNFLQGCFHSADFDTQRDDSNGSHGKCLLVGGATFCLSMAARLLFSSQTHTLSVLFDRWDLLDLLNSITHVHTCTRRHPQTWEHMHTDRQTHMQAYTVRRGWAL